MKKMLMGAIALSLVPAAAGAWETNDVTDKFGDVVGQATVMKGTMSGTHGDVEAGFFVRHMKRDGKITCDVFLAVGGFSYFAGDRLNAQYRVDKGDKVAITVAPSANNRSLFVDGAAVKPLLRQFTKGEELRIVVQQRLGGEVGFTFKAEVTLEAITPILKACSIDLDAPAPAAKK